MGRDFLWEVPTHVWDYVEVLSRQLQNEQISQGDFIDKLRSLGFPPDAQPGDNIRIRVTKPAVGQVPGQIVRAN